MLELRGISLVIDGTIILRDVSAQLKQGRIYSVLGPSGSGKTSLLRVIAGLERSYTGQVVWNGRIIDALDAQARGFGLMFQDFALFPHLNVLENVAFALKMRGVAKVERTSAAQRLLAQVGLSDLAQRGIHQLSGGERQRVALVRSLAHQPPLLMLDEPLGSLDARLRNQLGLELRDHLRQASVLTIYVTHDQSEAFMLADWVIVMAQGRIVQMDAPRQLYFRPRTRYVCGFLGIHNVVPAELVSREGEWVCLHPSGLMIQPDGRFEGVVNDVIFEGEQTSITVNWCGQILRWRVPSATFVPATGDSVRFDVQEDAVVALEE
ncbi:ABC transporter ATP-binding protein [Aggregatilineales bacterium SYSU G02658]